MGNVLTASTTLAAGTDHQVFCYDEQNRLTWSSSTSAAPPCGGSLTSGTLSSAAYGPVGYAYDPLDRMTSSPSGANVYDANHLHAIASIGSSYSAAYDAAGNMTCRSPSSSTLCAGRANGQLFTYDNEGRTTWWQNMPGGSPTATEQMAYDGEGRRVALEVNWSSPTYSIGSLEEQTAGTLTKYLPSAPGLPTGVRVGTNVLSYLASDGLGSVDETLDSNGVVTYQQLFTPYGSQRYSSGVPPTSYGFTGQRNDSDNGLDYYNARYYDPVGRQFASADTASDGLNRYGYVHGNPTTLTDPSGNRAAGCVHEDGQWYCPTGNTGGNGDTGGDGGNGGQPGCRGTTQQCNQWATALQAMIKDDQNKENGAWGVLGLVNLGLDLWDLFKDRGKGLVDTLIDVVAIAGDLLFTANYVLLFIQGQFGVDTSGLRHVFAVLSSFVNAVAGPLKALRNGLNWFVEAALNLTWTTFRTAVSVSNIPGLLMTILTQVAKGFIEDLGNNVRALADHWIQSFVSIQEADISNLQGESVDQFCTAHLSKCPGYPGR